MLTLKPNARCSTSALLMARVALPSTPSSAPTEPSSTRNTSSAIGGSTLTAQRPRLWPHPVTPSSSRPARKLKPDSPLIPTISTPLLPVFPKLWPDMEPRKSQLMKVWPLMEKTQMLLSHPIWLPSQVTALLTE